jgi:hypothetical protein
VKAADAKAAEALHAREAEIDRILAKIAEKGMDALSRAERETLRQATESKRDSEGGGGKPRG